VNDTPDDENTGKCPHDEITVDDKRKICLDCGEILSEGYFVVQPGANLQRRRKYESSLYKDIPFFLSLKTKEMTIEMYRHVTGDEVYRNTFKKSIIFACLHRATILCEEAICFDDILEMMNLKTHDASKGVNYVTVRIAKDSIYSIPLFSDEMSISSIISSLGVNIDPNIVKQIFNIIKEKSNVLNTSHYKSVVCGCIFFWMKMNNVPMTMKHFVKKVNMSEMTVVKKYIIITTVMLKMVLKELYVYVLSKVPKKNAKSSRSINAPQENTLYISKNKFTVKNYNDKDNISVMTVGGNRLPLEDVDDVTEWNMLLTAMYYDHSGNTLTPGLIVVQTIKDLYINFNCFDGATGLNGKEVLRSIITERCQK
jgi:transcription initiation factor TFIIIB Brf1 subunit/transcription initiation factor TFIIB